MADINYIPDMFDEIVATVRSSYDNAELEPYFDFGHVQDILKKLTAKDDNETLKFQKYPLVALILDQKEDREQNHNFAYSFSPSLIIVNTTKQEYTSQFRLENNFKPILYPIYNLLIEAIKNYKHFSFEYPSLMPHEKWDRYTWGAEGAFGNTGVVFNDHLDGIEIKINEINVHKKQINCTSLGR